MAELVALEETACSIEMIFTTIGSQGIGTIASVVGRALLWHGYPLLSIDVKFCLTPRFLVPNFLCRDLDAGRRQRICPTAEGALCDERSFTDEQSVTSYEMFLPFHGPRQDSEDIISYISGTAKMCHCSSQLFATS